jgi:hypothetical protein
MRLLFQLIAYLVLLPLATGYGIWELPPQVLDTIKSPSSATTTHIKRADADSKATTNGTGTVVTSNNIQTWSCSGDNTYDTTLADGTRTTTTDLSCTLTSPRTKHRYGRGLVIALAVVLAVLGAALLVGLVVWMLDRRLRRWMIR